MSDTNPHAAGEIVAHRGFRWVREGQPKIGEWYDDGQTFEPASHNWKQTGHKVQVYAFDPSDLLDRLDRIEDWMPQDFRVWLDETRVLSERLDAVTAERDWLRSVVDGLLPRHIGGEARSEPAS